MTIKRMVRGFIVGCMLGMGMQACTGAGNTAGNSGNGQAYAKDYDTMKEIVKKVISGSTLNIDATTESEEKDRISILVSKSKYVGDQAVRQNQGRVVISVVGTEKAVLMLKIQRIIFRYPGTRGKIIDGLYFPA